MKTRSVSVFFFLLTLISSLRAESLSLEGTWGFALDPQRRGEASDWPNLQPVEGKTEWTGWDSVTVPHCWSGDARYEHTGAAWYVRKFEVPAAWQDSHLRLRFSSVGDRCRVWVNGQFAGSHDGVNLAFSFDVTPFVKRAGTNVLVLEVDNSYSDTTIPGSRPGKTYASQVYPWWNYGGILGGVKLESEPAARLAGLKTDYVFRADGSVALTLRVALENRGAAVTASLSAGVASAVFTKNVALEATQKSELIVPLVIPAAEVKRWDLDHPVLYPVTLTLASPEGKHHLTRRIGLREIAVRNAQLLLNGEPVKVGGANRARGHPTWRGLEPRELVEQDMNLLKGAHLEFARLQHYPLSEEMFDWADEHGMLIIAEAGNWQFPPVQLSSPEMRRLWQQHMRELIETSWDRPSVVAWSVGNEYNSWSPEGVAWTKDMAEWVKSLDASRPVTFAALGTELGIKEQEQKKRSFHYVDFICTNYYGAPKGFGSGLDRVHALWPEKPIMISEYGVRADQVKDEAARIRHFQGILEVVRSKPYVCGLSYWAFNDYLSRYPGTTPGGYRAWGVVRADRSPRDLYGVMVHDLSPVTMAVRADPASPGQSILTVTARSTFPCAVLRGYALRVTDGEKKQINEIALPVLAPGQLWQQAFGKFSVGTVLEVIRPGGLSSQRLRIDGAD